MELGRDSEHEYCEVMNECKNVQRERNKSLIFILHHRQCSKSISDIIDVVEHSTSTVENGRAGRNAVLYNKRKT